MFLKAMSLNDIKQYLITVRKKKTNTRTYTQKKERKKKVAKFLMCLYCGHEEACWDAEPAFPNPYTYKGATSYLSTIANATVGTESTHMKSPFKISMAVCNHHIST